MILETVLLTLSTAGALYHLYALIQAWGFLDLAHINAPGPDTWPKVTLVIPACNEDATIEAAMKSVLRLDYPALELIIVEDRSTDDTAAITDAFAQAHEHVEVIHVEDLPEGWLGKLHALHVGTEAATGDFIVYADADVHFATDTLKRVVAWAEDERIDMVSLMPLIKSEGLMLTATLGAFGGHWFAGTRVKAVNTEGGDAYAGTGAFNMVRRRVFEQTEGWPWLKMEIADDIGLAYLMHRHGARGRIAAAPEHLSLYWYETFGDLVRGLEKNTFAVIGRFSALRALTIALGLALVALSPLALLMTSWAPLGIGCLIASALCAYLALPPSMRRGGYLLSPLANVLLSAILIRSTYKTVRRGGVDWRGTTYDTKALKANQRLLI